MHYCFYGKELPFIPGVSDLITLKKQLAEDSFSTQFEPIFVNQIHSNKVVLIDDPKKIHSSNNKPDADALVTNIRNLAIGVVTADCAPIILHDPVGQVIAIIHAGWRGAKSDIISNTVATMVNLGSKPVNLKAIIGPTIRQRSYEVSPDFYADFLMEKKTNQQFFIPSSKSGFWMFDLVSYVKQKLADQGIIKVIDQGLDTYSNPSKFFSYRRSCHLDKKETSRNFSLCSLS